MKIVYVIQHTARPDSENEDVKFIGVFDCENKAHQAVEELKKTSGFRNWPDGFCIDAYVVNGINWRDGFIDES